MLQAIESLPCCLPVMTRALTFTHGTGAGKTTTINMLTGVLPPSGGDAIMTGESIRSPGGMAAIRANMGVCPQFEVLWNDLTGHEHMVIFGHMKGLQNRFTVHAAARKLLDEVLLFVLLNCIAALCKAC